MRFRAIHIVALLCCLPLLTAAVPVRSSSSTQMWDAVRSNEWELTVRSIKRRIEPLTPPDGSLARPIGHFAIFMIDLTNRTSKPVRPSPGDFELWANNGVRSDNLAASPAGRHYAATTGLSPFGDLIPAGTTVTTIALFDIDAGASRLTMRFLPADQTIRIDECKCDLPSPIRTLIHW